MSTTVEPAPVEVEALTEDELAELFMLEELDRQDRLSPDLKNA